MTRFNAEGYSDPTAYEAILRAERKPREAVKPDYPRTYICSPYQDDVKRNTRNAVKYCRFALERGRFPIAPHIFLPRFMDDAKPAERELALSFGLRLLCGCKEVWVFPYSGTGGGRISEGMRREIHRAEQRGIPVKYFTADCEAMAT